MCITQSYNVEDSIIINIRANIRFKAYKSSQYFCENINVEDPIIINIYVNI